LFPSTFFLTRSLFFDLQATAPAFFNPSMSSSSLVSPRRRPLIHCCRTSRSLHRCHDPILVCLRLLWAKPRRYRSRKYSCCPVVSLPICIHSLVPWIGESKEKAAAFSTNSFAGCAKVRFS
jgi:hypothetical protein